MSTPNTPAYIEAEAAAKAARRTAKKAERGEQIVWCYEMSLRGFTYRQISQLSTVPKPHGHGGRHMSPQVVMRRIQEGFAHRVEPKREEYLAQEIDRLTRLYNKLDDAVERGDVAAINTFVRVQERLAKLLGLDAPSQLQQSLQVHYTVEGVDLEGLR